MPLTDHDRRWLDGLDPDDISAFDRGRLRALAGYAGPDDQDRIAQLTASQCDHTRTDRPAYLRGVARARARGNSSAKYPMQKEQ